MNTRSAGRARPPKRYTVDAFDDVPELKSSDEEPMIYEDGETSEDDFNVAAAASPSADEEDDLDLEGGLDNDPSSQPSDAGEQNLDDHISIADSDFDTTGSIHNLVTGSFAPARLPLLDGQVKSKGADDETRVYTRGATEGLLQSLSKAMRRLHHFGPAAEDYDPVQKARLRWAYEPALPSRKSEGEGGGGFHGSFFQSEQMREEEANVSWKWYHVDGGRNAINDRQTLSPLDNEEGHSYLPSTSKLNRSFLMGPYKQQKLFELSVGASIPLRHAWMSDGQAAHKGYKSGFVLNIGGKVNNLHWAPNQSASDQYLAVTALASSSTHDAESPSASTFVPQPPHRSSIQVWRFIATSDGFIDSESDPQLCMVLCTDWGHTQKLQWCPFIRKASELSLEESLGLLAAISSDGAMRVIDLPRPKTSDQTIYLLSESVAIESRPPDAIYTCLTWLSSSCLAVGCTNGYVAIFDLDVTLSVPHQNKVRPRQYFSISTTYILSLTSAYPSRPNLLIATSMAGYITLTDLSHPSPGSPSATVGSQRTRIAQPQLLWHDYSQCVLTVDDSYTLRAYPLRRPFTTISTSRYRSLATALAGSPWHPFVLAGTAAGDVVGANPGRRMADPKASLWNQTWFSHEWRRPHQDTSTADADAMAVEEPEKVNNATDVEESHRPESVSFCETRSVAVEQPDKMDNAPNNHQSLRPGKADQKYPPNGLSRILEGFKIEHVNLKYEEGKAGDASYVTVYEEETAVTALAWNPNLHVAGWAAAGMADGLVRVEDLAS